VAMMRIKAARRICPISMVMGMC